MRAVRAVAVVFLLLAVPLGLHAQAGATAIVSGTVSDTTGAVIPDVSVVLLDTATNLSRTQLTNAAGYYVFLNVMPGTYRLTASKEGFRQTIVSAVKVEVAKTHTVNLTLEVGAIAETVEVVAGVGIALQTSDATVGTVVGGAELQMLPTLNRQATSLLLLQPLVQPGGGNIAVWQGAGVAGSRSDQTVVFLDGGDASNNTEGSGGYAFVQDATIRAVIQTPVESIEEFRVSTTNPTASFGRTGGGAMNLVTKRGTNTIHGSVYWYHQNDNLDANTWDFNRTGVRKPEKKDNRYGFSVGGPVIKDSTFLYGHFEGRRFPRKSTILRYVPTPTMAAGTLRFPDAAGNIRSYNLATAAVCGAAGNLPCDPRGLGIPAVMQSYFGLYPAGNDPSEGDRFNTIGFRGAADSTLTDDFMVVRFDQKLTDRWNLMATYRYQGTAQPDPVQIDIGGTTPGAQRGVPATVGQSPVHPRYVTLGVDGQITNTLTSQFRGSWTRNWWEWQRFDGFAQVAGTTGAIDVGGDAAIGSLSEPMNIDTQNARSRIWAAQDYFVSENLAWVKGSHTLQFGGNWRRWDIFHRRNDKVLEGVTFLRYFSRTGGQFLTVPADNRPPTCTTGQSGFCIVAGDVAQWDMMYANALGLMDLASIVITRDPVALNPNPLGTPFQASVIVDAYETFFMDTWRATPSLTFTFGLNYSIQVPGEEASGSQMVMVYTNTGTPVYADAHFRAVRAAAARGQILNPGFSWSPVRQSGLKRTAHIDWHNFGPRLAAAWNPSFREGFLGSLLGDRKTVIRGGYAKTFDRINGVGLVMTPLLGVGVAQVLQCSGPTSAGTCLAASTTPANAFRIGWDGATIALPTPAPGTIPFTVGIAGESSSRLHDPGRKISFANSYNVTWQREVPGNMILEFGYVGKMGRRLITNLDINAVPLYFRDVPSGQTFVQAFDAVAQWLRPVAQGGAGGTAATVPVQLWFENLLRPLATLVAEGKCRAGATPDTSATMCLARRFGTDFINGHINSLAITRISVGGFFSHPLGFVNGQVPTNQLVGSTGRSWYNAGFVSVRKRPSHGLSFGANYTWSNSIDDWGLNQQYVNSPPNTLFPDIGIGPSLFDRRHTLNAYGVYELPFGRGRRFTTGNWVDKIIGGWGFSWIFNAYSGVPLCVSHGGTWGGAGGTFNTACAIGPQFTVSRNNGIAGSGGVGDIGTTNVNGFANPQAVFNSFRRQLYSVDGRSGRGFIRGQNRWDFDFGFNKRTEVTERVSVTFNLAITNPFNYPQLNDPGMALTSPRSFGVITSQYNSPRTMNFGLRVDF